VQTNKLVQVVSFPTCMREMLSSKLGRDTNCSESTSCYSSVQLIFRNNPLNQTMINSFHLLFKPLSCSLSMLYIFLCTNSIISETTRHFAACCYMQSIKLINFKKFPIGCEDENSPIGVHQLSSLLVCEAVIFGYHTLSEQLSACLQGTCSLLGLLWPRWQKKYVSSETQQLINWNDIMPREACSLHSQRRSNLRHGDEWNNLLRIVNYFIKIRNSFVKCIFRLD
jgi:hypothetical protein